jgi:hypothetical protein
MLSSDFKRHNSNKPEGLVVFVNGDLTIPVGIGSDASYSLEALFVVRGDIIIDGPENMTIANGQLKIKGGFYTTGDLNIKRKFNKADREANPLLIVDADPIYWFYESGSELSSLPVFWEEI